VQSLLIAAARPHNQKGSTNMWEYRGQKRPPFAVAPKKGQESVWDYTRPPKIVADKRRVEVKVGDRVIADSQRTVRVLETASPPTFYIPPDDIRMDVLAPHPSSSWCEWKGTAKYWALNVKDRPREMIGWTYPKPTPEFESITGWFSFYPGRSPASSTPAGSRRRSSVRSRARRTATTGEYQPPDGLRLSCCQIQLREGSAPVTT
jgi:uncharacterized protein (DUF427 family)